MIEPRLGAGRPSEALLRRRRGRNLALLAVLVAVAALFYALAMFKLGHQVGR